MTNVVHFTGVTSLDTTAENVLTGALEADLSEAIVIGRTKDGLHFFASTSADGGDVLWLIEQAKVRLLQHGGVMPMGD